MKNFFQNIIEGSTYQGLEIYEIEGLTHYSLLKLKKNQGELHIVFEKVFDNIETFAANVLKRNPLFLTINSSKVLKKQIHPNSDLKPAQYVVEAFPNLDLENFYYEILDYEEISIVSISKKEYVEGLIDTLRSHGIVPKMISLGVSGLVNSLAYLNTLDITGSNFRIKSDNQSDPILESKSILEEETLKINGLELSNTCLLAFSTILGHLTGQKSESNIAKRNEPLDNSFKNLAFFDIGLKFGLGIILAALLINFLLFSYYRDKTQSMETSSSIEQQLAMLSTLKDRLSLKEQRLDMLLNSINSKSTFYLDRLAFGLPSSVQLDNMVYQPLLKPIQPDKPIEQEHGIILISGYTNDKIEFAQWIDQLEQIQWINTAEILGYQFDTKKSDKFSIKLDINETE